MEKGNNKEVDFFTQSVQRQIGSMGISIADRDNVIALQQQKIKESEVEIEQKDKKIKELEMENRQLHQTVNGGNKKTNNKGNGGKK